MSYEENDAVNVIIASERQAYEEEVSKLNEKLSSVLETKSSLENKIVTMKEDLKDKTAEILKISNSAHEEASRREGLENELIALKENHCTEKANLENAIAEKNHNHEKEIHAYIQKDKERVEDISKLRSLLDEEKAKLIDVENKLSVSFSIHSSKLNENSDQGQAREIDISMLLATKSNLENEIVLITESVQKKEVEIKDLSQAIASEISVRELLENELTAVKEKSREEMNTSQKLISELREKLRKVKGENNVDMNEKECMKELHNDVIDEKFDVEDSRSDSTCTMQLFNSKIETLVEDFARKQEFLDKQIADLNEYILVLNNREDDLKKELEFKDSEISEYECSLSKLRKELEAESSRCLQLEKELSAQENMLQESKTESEDQSSIQMAAVSDMKKHVSNLEHELSTVRNAFQNVSSHNVRLENEIALLKKSNSNESNSNHLTCEDQTLIDSDKLNINTSIPKRDEMMKPLGSATAALIGSPKNRFDLILPQDVEELNKSPNMIDFIDALTSSNWKKINLIKVAEKALQNYYFEKDRKQNFITKKSLQTCFIQEFSAKKQYWYATLTIGKRVWNPSIQSGGDIPFSCGLVGRRMGRIVYCSKEYAIDALLFFVLRSVDFSGKWIREFLGECDRSCLLRKNGSQRSVPWAALIRKADSVYLADVKEGPSTTGLFNKFVPIGEYRRNDSCRADKENARSKKTFKFF